MVVALLVHLDDLNVDLSGDVESIALKCLIEFAVVDVVVQPVVFPCCCAISLVCRCYSRHCCSATCSLLIVVEFFSLLRLGDAHSGCCTPEFKNVVGKMPKVQKIVSCCA